MMMRCGLAIVTAWMLILATGTYAADAPAADPAPAPAATDGTAAPAAPPQGLGLPFEPPPADVKSSPTAEEVDAAIERGVKYLYTQRKDNGLFSELDPHNVPTFESAKVTKPQVQYPGGMEVMALVALTYFGESLQKPEFQQSLKALMELPLWQTYTLGFRVVTLAELYRRPSSDEKMKSGFRQAMKADVESLAAIQIANGGWFYDKSGTDKTWDFSNTQIAILAMREAVSCGVEVNPEIIRKVQQLYLDRQRADGAWNYGRPGQWEGADSYGSMTAAAVASLLLCRDFFEGGVGCPCSGDKSRGKRSPQVDKAIQGGLKWLGENFDANGNPGKTKGRSIFPYWLYAAERVAIATGFKYFGKHNWYIEGSKALLSVQKPDGAVSNIPDTSFALLFWIKGRGPILMNKLQHDGQWDNHPYDAANLARYASGIKEQIINWQVIGLDVPLWEMHDSPILYITAEAAITLTGDQKKKLRYFTDTGGTIFFEASCGNRAANTWWDKTCKEIWPEWELKNIEKDHPVWKADLDLVGPVPALRGMSDGLRTFIFYSARDISCAWNTNNVAKNPILFKLGTNLYAYATDRGRLRSRLATQESGTGTKYAGQTPTKDKVKTQITVARLKTGGDWYAGARYYPWQILDADLEARLSMSIEELPAIAPGSPVPPGTTALYLCGRNSFDFDKSAALWLKAYLAGGGFLVAEAVMGDARFDASLRAALATAGLGLKELPESDPLITGQLGGATGYAMTKVDYTFSLQVDRVGKPLPQLFGICDGEKLVGLYSPFDLMFSQTGCKSFGNRGYGSADARALATNQALLLSTR